MTEIGTERGEDRERGGDAEETQINAPSLIGLEEGDEKVEEGEEGEEDEGEEEGEEAEGTGRGEDLRCCFSGGM